MAVTHGHGNPNWTRDETILALALYFDCEGRIPSSSDNRVQALSELLRELPYHSRAARRDSFRNPDGVAFKLQNLRQMDTGKGLGNVSNMDRAVWEEFGNDPVRTRELARLIRSGIEVSEATEDQADEDIFTEGRIVTEVHKQRERHPRLREKLIQQRRRSGRLVCELCNCFPHPSMYGEAIFEAHHILPLAAAMERKTKLSDMALLCANCHRMIHRAIARKARWINLSEARQMFRFTDALSDGPNGGDERSREAQ